MRVLSTKICKVFNNSFGARSREKKNVGKKKGIKDEYVWKKSLRAQIIDQKISQSDIF